MTDRQAPALFRFLACERSYFSGKVRPALRAKSIFFREELPTPEIMQEIIRRTGLHFIPVVVTPEDETWQDTSEILDSLEARVPQPVLYPTTPVQRVVSYLVELYADEFMVLPAMYYRWYTPEGRQEARDSFVSMTGNRERALQFAEQMGGTLQALGVTQETAPAIEEHLFDLFDHLETLFAEQGFLLGNQMSLADCALIGPLYAHLYLDLVPGPILRSRAPRTAFWIERMNHPLPAQFGGFHAGDGLHPAMLNVLRLIGQDALPVLLDTVRDFERWADDQPKGEFEPPRVTGFHPTSLRGGPMSRYTNAYTLWMVQRPLDAYRALDAGQRAAVDRALAGTGCEALLAYQPRYRLFKRNHKLVCAPV